MFQGSVPLVTHHLVSVPEIAELLGISQQRVHQLVNSREDFPKPEANLAIGRVWRREVIEEWDRTHHRRPGRPTKT